MGLFRKRASEEFEGTSLVDEIYGRRAEQEISRIERDAERIEAYAKMRTRQRRQALLRVGAVVILLLVLTVGVLYIGYRSLFVVSEIEVVGESPYTDAEICEKSGIIAGLNLFSFSASQAETRLVTALPYIGSLEVDRHIPDKVTITIKYEEPVYYTEIYGKIYLMSETLRVLGEAGDTDLSELIWLRLPGVKSIEVGSPPVLLDSITEKVMPEIIAAVEESVFSGRMTQIDMRNIYRLKMVCDNMYLFTFGEYDGLASKFMMAEDMLKDERLANGDKAKLDLSNIAAGHLAIDNQLDFTK